MTYLRKIKAYGTEDHDSADADGPIKVGGKAIDYEPDSDAEQGPTEVSANDRVNQSYNLRGESIEGINSRYHTLDNINTQYNDTTSTATSSPVDCWNYRYASIGMKLYEGGTATDIIFQIETSLDGTNYSKLFTPGWLQDWRYTDGAINAGVSSVCVTVPIACQKLRVHAIANGTTADNTFGVSSATLYLRN